MTNITPELATSFEEMNNHIIKGVPSIVVTNKNLFPAIKKRIKSIKVDKKLSTTSKATGFGMLAITILSSEISIPVGLTLAGASFLLGRRSNFVKQASQYKILDLSKDKSEKEDFLILIKVKGENAFNENNDVLDLENFKTSNLQSNTEVNNENSI